MIPRLAARSLAERPVRSAVLAAGFGVGIGVMAGLLGIGDVILHQARSPDLLGGGDVIVGGGAGRVESARFVMRTLLHGRAASDVRAVSPLAEAPLYLVDGERVDVVYATAGIPDLERTIGDPETAAVAAWRNAPGDAAWVDPAPEALLRAMDRFHPVPDVPAYADSWAEWLYFNGRAGATRFYLSFLVGAQNAAGAHDAGVRLQLDHRGKPSSYAERVELEAVELARAPDLDIGSSSVRLDGLDYRIRLDLPPAAKDGPRITGEIVLHAVDAASMPPLALRGADGWVSGYTVPVLSGALSGQLVLGGETIDLDGGRGYHDHNWGFWKGVTWQWGQVEGDDLSLVYGRVRPPAEVADPERVPALLAVVGPDGPLGFATSTTIRETDDGAGRPQRIAVRASGSALELDLTFDVERLEASPTSRAPDDVLFLQMRGRYRVTGRVGGRDVAFERDGSAETFRPARAEGEAAR